jgi:hypothetical protein
MIEVVDASLVPPSAAELPPDRGANWDSTSEESSAGEFGGSYSPGSLLSDSDVVSRTLDSSDSSSDEASSSP